MDRWDEPIIARINTVPPTCLSGFQCTSTPDDPWHGWAKWSLACTCGHKQGRVLGYPLGDYDPKYAGEPMYLSPLSFQCSACNTKTPVFDIKHHGYDAEFDKRTGRKSPGTGYPVSGDPASVPCSNCDHTTFTIRAACGHSHFDHIEDEPELESQAPDFFDAFNLIGTCSSCGKEMLIAVFETA